MRRVLGQLPRLVLPVRDVVLREDDGHVDTSDLVDAAALDGTRARARRAAGTRAGTGGMSTPTSDTLTGPELAARLGISVRTLHKRRKDGTAPEPLPMAGHPRWSKAMVEQFLAHEPSAIRGRRRRF